MLKLVLQSSPLLCLVSLLLSHTVSAQTGCDSACSAYSAVLDSCIHAGTGDPYYTCVCYNSNFNSSISQCLSCVGPNSVAAGVAKRCQTQAPDCTVACSGFSLLLQSCGDTSSPGFKSCMCSSAYDTVYTGVFNQQIQSCVSCENGGGAAEYWEAYCCAHGYGCQGASPQASADAATMSVTSIPASTTTPISSPSPARSGNSADVLAAGGLGAVIGNALLWGLL